jgi:signal transduction histidine kinase
MALAAGTNLARAAPSARGFVGAGTLAAVAVVVAAVTGTWLAWTADQSTRLRLDLPGPIAAAEAVTAALLIAAAVASRRAGAGLAIAALGWLTPLAGAWPIAPVLATAALAASPLVVPGLAAALLLPRPGPGADVRRRAVVLSAWLGVGGVLAHLATYDAFGDPSCRRTCADTTPVLEQWVTGRTGAGLAAGFTAAATAVVLVVMLRQRRPSRWVLCLSAVAVVLPALAAAQRWTTWDDVETHAHIVRDVAVLAAVALACTVTLGSWWRTRQVRRDLESLVAGLTQLSGGREAPAAPWQEVHFAVPGERRWVDVTGADMLDTDQGIVVQDREGEPMLRLSATGAAERQHEVETLTPATRLLLHNARLAAVVRARSRDVRTSQRRIVATADGERHRIERDLHDGAQQRLVSAAFHLRVAMTRVPVDTATDLRAAEEDLHRALARLRELAHGSAVGLIAEHGLAAALDDAVAASSVPTTLTLAVPGALDAATERAVWAVTVAGLDNVGRYAGATSAAVSVVRESGVVTVTVADDGRGGGIIGPGLTAVADRVGALGGRLTLHSPPGLGTGLTVEMPCGS